MTTTPASPPADADAVLEALDPEQREVAANPIGPMCVLAGAGTGKTRAITHRIAYGVRSGAFAPQRVLAVTFTARAAGEMRTRLRELGVAGVQARTFHAAALRQLHFFWPQAIGGGAPEVLAHKAPVVAAAAGQLRMDFDRPAIRDLAGEIEWAKVSMLTPETYPAAARAARREPAGLDVTAMSRLMEAYEQVKAARGVIDFEDVLLLTVGILAERADIARTVRDQYRHFVVDEYQDVNALQQRLLDLWVGERADLCVVGDAAQTIYSFTGASPRHLLEFPKAHPGAPVVKLVRNYRSTPQIIALANAVVRGGTPLGGQGSLVELRAQAAPGQRPDLTEYPDDPAEAAGVADRIARLVASGTPAGSIAVLFRTNAQSEALESALAEAGVPYLVRGGERFWNRQEVRAAVVLLRGATRADDGSIPLGDLVRDVLTGSGWSQQPPAPGGALRERWESLQAIVALADDLVATSPGAGLRDFLAEVEQRAAAQHAPTVQGVTLASLHAAKGLEWEVVFLIGVSSGLLPISMAEGGAAIEEERRLLYVGLTRARAQLHLSWAQSRHPGGRAGRSPSPFLVPAAGELGGSSASLADPGATGARRRSRGQGGPKVAGPVLCRGCGTTLVAAAQRRTGRCENCPPTYDEDLFERLRSWRSSVSRAASVPAYVVFTDATLTRIAEDEPATRELLAKVPGIGAHKLDAYGQAVIALVGGASVQAALDAEVD